MWIRFWICFLPDLETYKIVSHRPKNKMTSKDDIKALVSLKFLRPWSQEMRDAGLSLMGRQDELDYFSDDSEPETGLGGGLGTSVMPRAVAIERLRMAQRARLKAAGIRTPVIAEPPRGPADLLAGLLDAQAQFLNSPSSSSRPSPPAKNLSPKPPPPPLSLSWPRTPAIGQSPSGPRGPFIGQSPSGPRGPSIGQSPSGPRGALGGSASGRVKLHTAVGGSGGGGTNNTAGSSSSGGGASNGPRYGATGGGSSGGNAAGQNVGKFILKNSTFS